MFGFGKKSPDLVYGAVVDIGSGSVGAAIVLSNQKEKNPVILWSHRERVVLRDAVTLEESIKHITTALVNTLLLVGSEGLKVLAQESRGASIDVLQVAISAPWSYTITKTVGFEKEKTFEITKRLIQELIETAQKQALETIDEDDIIKKLGLEITTQATINISANNYQTEEPYGQQVNRLSVAHVSAITQKHLLDTLREGAEKVLPKARIERNSFMLVYYWVLKQLAPETTEICLIDVTFEATEIGIVRDGILQYVTHTPAGTFSLAREIAALCNIPHEEALAYVRGNTAIEDTLSDSKKADLLAILAEYENQLTELFKRTGDSLAIPRTLFLHTDSRTEPFFSKHIKNAANQATKSDPSVHLVTSKLLEGGEVKDNALLLSAFFFHIMRNNDDFKHV